jgi:uncharacterized coiled-coil protein SlyX
MTDNIDIIVGIGIAVVTATAVCAIAVILCFKKLISNMANKINQSVTDRIDAVYAAMEQRYGYVECDIQELDRVNTEHTYEENELWGAIKRLTSRMDNAEKRSKPSAAQTMPVPTQIAHDGALPANANIRSLDLEVRRV